MLQNWRHIAVFLDASAEGAQIGRQAARLAKEHDSHLVAVYGVAHDQNLRAREGFARGPQAVSHAARRQREEEEQKAVIAGRNFGDIANEFDISSEFRLVWRDSFDNARQLNALHCDLVVSTHPKPADLPDAWSAEHLLLETGTPVLVIPAAWGERRVGNKVAIAWNRSREARRAVNDAMPILTRAAETTILMVDAETDPDHPDEGQPGSNLKQHLLKHHVNAEVVNVLSERMSIPVRIMQEVRQRDIDLLILGAYSRTRIREVLFGGTTRAFLKQIPVPLLISR